MSLVLELQQDALDSSVTVSALLRKAFVVARKLDIKEFEEWTNLELNGYGNAAVVPEYRMLNGIPKGYNPYHGWRPISFESEETRKKYSIRGTNQSIPEIENFLDGARKSGFQMPYPAEVETNLRNAIGFDFLISLHIDAPLLNGTLEKVRGIILNWSLTLEKDGITGGIMTFSKEEKEAANKNTYNINNFYSPVSNQQIQQGNDSAIQHITNTGIDNAVLIKLRGLINDLRTNITSLGISNDHITEFEADIGTLECQINSTKPKGPIIKESLSSLKKIFESATGGVIANQIYTRIPALLQLLG